MHLPGQKAVGQKQQLLSQTSCHLSHHKEDLPTLRESRPFSLQVTFSGNTFLEPTSSLFPDPAKSTTQVNHQIPCVYSSSVSKPGKSFTCFLYFKYMFFSVCNVPDALVLCLCRFLMEVDHFCPISTHLLTHCMAPKAWL